MAVERLVLPSDPHSALAFLRAASLTHPVVVFKRSPTCPISHAAEARFRAWLATLCESDALRWASIDVVSERVLARGLTAALAIPHESPQALWFVNGELVWHASHDALTHERLVRAFAQAPA